MAKQKAPNQRKAYTAHFNRVERYAALVDAIYAESIKEFSKLALSVGYDPSKPFQFSDYPHIKARVAELQREITANIQGVIVNGITAEWEESNLKNDALARSVIGIRKFDLDEKGRNKIPTRFKPYFNNNADALGSFVDRKANGLGLSAKVWKLADQYKSDLELALSVGISDGRSAAELSRDVRQYLNEPKKLFRRVMQDEKLRLSKAAKAYHPGQGVCRSSYKNAMRLTRTEINTAYRTADNARWGQMDFVVGFEVKRSGRGYDCSVCESLAGKYPKSFAFTGWHPHCRCYMIPILKTDEEFWAWDGRGEAPTDSVNTVGNVPQGFKNWTLDNASRINKAKENGTLPYFLKDNQRYYQNSVKIPVGKAIPNIKNKENIDLNDALTAKIGGLSKKYPSLFGGQDLSVELITDQNFFMGVDPIVRQLQINDKTFTFGGVEFNPARDLNDALEAIRVKKRLTFSQEYAVESLWHEMMHLQGKGWRDMGIHHSVQLVSIMETLNQFCARMSYDKLIKKLGGESTFNKEIMFSGFGYHNQVRQLNTFLFDNKISNVKLFKAIYPRMTNAHYDDLPFILNAFFLARKVNENSIRKFIMLW